MAATLGARGDRSAVLDAVRAIACVMVFLAHASEYDGDGALIGLKNGVMLFFALSGYLLYRPFLRGPVDLRRYAVHRIARIVPASGCAPWSASRCSPGAGRSSIIR